MTFVLLFPSVKKQGNIFDSFPEIFSKHSSGPFLSSSITNHLSSIETKRFCFIASRDLIIFYRIEGGGEKKLLYSINDMYRLINISFLNQTARNMKTSYFPLDKMMLH